MTSLNVHLDGDTLAIGDRFRVTFQRTLRIPDDGRDYPLPPGFGPLPLVATEGGFVVPMYQREALWLSFTGAHWKPNAVKVGLGTINAVTGSDWTDDLRDDPQDYLVCPGQPWLDGIVAGEGRVRQFVAMPLGSGATVEEQLSDRQPIGGIRLQVFDPKPGCFPDEPPPSSDPRVRSAALAEPAMGLGAGGRVTQKLYVDRYGLDTWDRNRAGDAFVQIVNSVQFRELTGQDPPSTPIDARAYTEHGLPWFSLFDEDEKTLAATEALRHVKGVDELTDETTDESFDVDPRQVRGLGQDDV